MHIRKAGLPNYNNQIRAYNNGLFDETTGLKVTPNPNCLIYNSLPFNFLGPGVLINI
jgi:hypothetical protein